MRTLRVISLLFSLGQLLLILKLIEYVRGNPTNSQIQYPNPDIALRNFNKSASSPTLQTKFQVRNNTRNSRSFFLSSKVKQRKYKPWLTTSETPTTDYPYLDSLELDHDDRSNFSNFENSTLSVERMDVASLDMNNITETEQGLEGRLCPGCESGTCGQGLRPYGFPFIPAAVALVVGIVWFFIFLFIWYLFQDAGKPTAASGGGYGYGSGGEHTGGWSHDSSRDISNSVLNFITGGSTNSLNQLTSFVTDSVFNLAKMYTTS